MCRVYIVEVLYFIAIFDMADSSTVVSSLNLPKEAFHFILATGIPKRLPTEFGASREWGVESDYPQ